METLTISEKVIVARFGEVHLKGDNRGWFLRVLKQNLITSVGAEAKVNLINGRFIISEFGGENTDLLIKKAANVFGIVSVSAANCIESRKETILDFISRLKIEGSFKVEVNRADKSFPHKSPEFAAICGGIILNNNPNATVDVHQPKKTVCVDIREGGRAFLYYDTIKGVGGMPVGTAGRALVMLSGGIDSPVAAFLAAKRGLAIDCVHFASPPYTSDFALEKVKSLVKVLSDYCGRIRLFIVPFTEVQQQIRSSCNEAYMITIMRRFMIRIAEKLCEEHKIDAIITGESLAQVASQTIAGITTNNVCAANKPILRPLIMFDKSEIVEIAKKIGTYETSIQPHADCCTVFVPAHPAIRPTIQKCEFQEKNLDINGIVGRAIDGIDIV